MITAQNLSKSYGLRTLFEKISFSISDGERVGLVGRNGQGKTTLLRILMGEENADEGMVSIPKNYRIGHLTQHLHFSETSILSEACKSLSPERQHEEWTVKRILAGLGFFQSDFDRPPSEFSGGFQVRLNLAKVLVSDPDMLLLDEPTNFLDIVSIRWLIDFLRAWKGELILVSHDRNVMDSIVTHVMGIHRQKMRKMEGNTHDYYGQIQREEEVFENKRLNDEKERKQMQTFISKFRAKARQANLVQSRIKCLEKRTRYEKLENIANLSFSFNAAPFEAKYPLETDDLCFSYSPQTPFLIDHLNLTLETGDRLCIIGKNGRGKSTLVKLLSGQLQGLEGKIRMHSLVRIAYYAQAHTAALSPENTIEDEIALAGIGRERKSIRDVCGAMMFSGDEALKKIKVLSGGEKCRVLLGKLLMQPANLLILDEPTHHLDMESTEALMEAINDFDGTVIMVTHNEYLLDSVATKLVVFQGDRQLVFPGTYSEFLDQVGWEEERQEVSASFSETNSPAALPRDQIKRLKAEFVQRRSKVLTPLKRDIEQAEKEIERLENEQAQGTQAMVEASEKQDALSIVSLSKAFNSNKHFIEEWYVRLEEATDRYEIESHKFEQEAKLYE